MRWISSKVTVALLFGAALLPACASVIPPETPSPFRRAPWYLLSEDGTDLVVGAVGGGHDCDDLAGIDVIESDDRVEIRAWMEDVEVGRRGCFAIRGIHDGLVKLDAPIGDRVLVGCLLGGDQLDVREDCREISEQQ